MPRQPEVTDASNVKQVESARQRERSRRQRLENAYRAVLTTEPGRIVLWDIISRAGVFASPWSNSAMEIHRNVGRSDYGRELLADLIELDPVLYMQMEADARHQQRRDADETDAAHAKPAPQQGVSR